MSISHWGIFPGYFVPEPMAQAGFQAAAVWRPVDFDTWCAACG